MTVGGATDLKIFEEREADEFGEIIE